MGHGRSYDDPQLRDQLRDLLRADLLPFVPIAGIARVTGGGGGVGGGRDGGVVHGGAAGRQGRDASQEGLV